MWNLNWALKRCIKKLYPEINCINYKQYKDHNKEFNYVVFDTAGQPDSLINILAEQNIDTIILPISLRDMDLEPVIGTNKNYNDRVRNELIRTCILEMINEPKYKRNKNIQAELLVNSIRDIKPIKEEIDQGLSSL